VLIAPPFITTAEQIETIVERLSDAIDGALSAIA
jgi:adenosylmethionine-8-amino-7-oxononanoate aminotransferase